VIQHQKNTAMKKIVLNSMFCVLPFCFFTGTEVLIKKTCTFSQQEKKATLIAEETNILHPLFIFQ